MNSNPGIQDEQSGEWLPVALVALQLGVSPRAIQKRCASGTLPARRVAGARGEVWEVEAGALTANANANGEPVKANKSVRVRASVRPDSPLPVSLEGEHQSERRTVESEREHELKDEVRFLRGIIEQLQRDGAETRAALREALKAQPRQLEQGSERNGQQRPQKGETGNDGPGTSNGARIEADGAETGLSYGDIADMIEQELNQ